MEEKVENIVNNAVDAVNALLPTSEMLSKDRSTVVQGDGARLDSMGFLNLLVALEDEIDSQLGFRITLAEAVLPGGKRAYTLGDIHATLIQLIADRRVA